MILAFATFLLAIGLAVGHIYSSGPASFTLIYEKFVGFITASILMSVLQGSYCYLSSFREGKLLALGGNSGNFIYDVSWKLHGPVLHVIVTCH